MKEEESNQLQKSAEELIEKLRRSINYESEFTGNPLQIFMLANVHKKDENLSTTHLPNKFDLCDLYHRFLNQKNNIYVEEKLKPTMNNEAVSIRQGKVNLFKAYCYYALNFKRRTTTIPFQK